jgi:3D (Asp-Asp-Asp) domain-containing protein/peptidoglycan hydrolase CwlO-like protein
VLVGVSVAAAAGTGESLRRHVSTLESRTHRVLLDLYALDSRLHAAQAHLSSLQAHAARLRDEQTLLAQQLSATHKTLITSQQQLGQNLRTLYKQADVSTLAVMLGANSLDDALSELDALNSVADESQHVVEVAREAQSRLARLRDALQERRAAIDAAVAEAQRTTTALASAHAARIGFISRLRTERKLEQSQIAALQTAAQRVERKSNELQAQASTAQPSAAATTPVSAAAGAAAETGDPVNAPSPPVIGSRTLNVSSTGYALMGRTATGIPVGYGVVAVDPTVIPLGTRLTIPGYGEGVAADTGGGVRGNTIDIWFPTLALARSWGHRTVTITLH